MIHPTAIVDPNARIAAGTRVGPGAIIEAGAEIGENCEIQAYAIITSHVRIGTNNLIGHGAIIGGDPQDTSFQSSIKSEVRIGNHNRIREYVTIHRGSKDGGVTSVGDHCFLMGGTHLGHDAKVGNRVIIANNCLLGGHVQVHDHAFLGGACAFHQFVRIGKFAISQGGSKIARDIPPYVLAAAYNEVHGLNTIGLKRGGFGLEQRNEIKRAFSLLYREGLNVSQALEASAGHTWSETTKLFWDFVASAKKRGICTLASNSSDRTDTHDD